MTGSETTAHAGRDEPARPGRLIRRGEFLAVQRGEKRRGPLFLLEVLAARPASEPPRVGYTVTAKTGNAVERNRIRRRLKEAVRTHAALQMQPGTDYVIVGRREVLGAPFETLKSELSRRIAGTKGAAGPQGHR